MSLGLTQIIEQIRTLSVADRAQLLDWLMREGTTSANLLQTSDELGWLTTKGQAFVGEWVAVRGDELIAHDKDHRVVFEAARAAGDPLPLVALVEPTKQAFWGGWV
jgi:Family of unknown function (DUF5678)